MIVDFTRVARLIGAMKVAIISGTSIARSGIFDDCELHLASTPFGEIEYKESSGVVVINRHGFRNPLPPHRSNYRGYVHLLKELDVQATLSINSVGSLTDDLPPGSLVSCSDYVSFAPITFIDDAPSGFAPSIDNGLLGEIEPRLSCPVSKDRVYAQTKGPRFETKAEVRILQNWGCDVVGMTLANECDLLLESGISVTSLCVVDNFAHGIGGQQLSYGVFHDLVHENQKTVDEALEVSLESFKV